MVDGCTEPIYVKKVGYCRKHYSAWNRHGDPLAWKRHKRASCSVEGCELPQAAHGYCDRHYRADRRYGTPTPPPRPTTCSVSDCDGSVDALGMCDLHYRRHRRDGDQGRPLCEWCSASLTDATAKWRKRYCSKECRELSDRQRRQDTYRETWLRKYGLTVAEYDGLLVAQGGGCAICDSRDPRGRAKSPYFHVDHDHGTGRVRGLLCAPCNTGLGSFGDDPARLRSAIAYLSEALAMA